MRCGVARRRSSTRRQRSLRQREILRLLAEGLSAKQMAQKLNISQRTVEFHKYRMMETLGAKTSSDLIHFAIKNGIVEA